MLAAASIPSVSDRQSILVGAVLGTIFATGSADPTLIAVVAYRELMQTRSETGDADRFPTVPFTDDELNAVRVMFNAAYAAAAP